MYTQIMARCRESYQSIRQNIVEMVLATDMSKHFEHLSKFTTGVTSQVRLCFYVYLQGIITIDVDVRFSFCEQYKFG